jgi:hypothetical protein
VVGVFPGAQVSKTRRSIALSTEDSTDVGPTLWSIRHNRGSAAVGANRLRVVDLKQPGLNVASYFRQREVRLIGRLSDSDWESVRLLFKAGSGGE